MYLYNISIIVENERHESLIQWVRENWLSTLPEGVKLLKMLDSPHEGQTYCVQLMFEYPSDIPNFQKEKLILLQEYIAENHLEKAFLFDSTMKYL
ncbi:DUF4286 family protein [Sphingobacterium bovistauri]|uniref:DUF4286 family protein n=1 Tax=Sphingobacterium bovistauri TaxID=2781959 RepID=A0ABS7Z9L4_9SPHI|nr:DUF4286 family protein [Sphingobacterium bovistauri]MCA5006086.1 DUF4286 family protein [Sphingobacterium bovistauri]